MKRREFVKKSSLFLGFAVTSQSLLINQNDAYALPAPMQVLGIQETRIIDILGEAIVPGAKSSGLSQYLDQQLSQKRDSDCLLMIRYLGVPSPFNSFYLSGLSAVDKSSGIKFGKSFDQLNEQELEEFVELMAKDSLPDWKGPPSSFFYFVFRSDAIDVTYGTQDSFRELGIPYMAHIIPTKNW